MQLNLFHIILILIVFQSYLYAFVLFTHKRGKRISNIILASLLIILGTQMLNILLKLNNIFTEFFEQLSCCYGMIYGVLCYYYTRSLIYKGISIKAIEVLHLVPFFLSVLLSIAGFPFCNTWGDLLYISIFGYLIASLKQLYHYKQTVKHATSRAEAANISWLQLMLILFAIIITMDLFQRITDLLNWNLPEDLPVTAVMVMILIFVNTMVFKGLKHPELFIGLEDESNPNTIVNQAIENESNTLLNQYHQLCEYIEQEQVYLKPALTLNELSELTKIPMRQLSQAINQHGRKNFSEFINGYRIEEAKKRLLQPKDSGETILEVMYQVGFNSKSVFNTAFKKQTGMTPSQYKQTGLR